MFFGATGVHWLCYHFFSVVRIGIHTNLIKIQHYHQLFENCTRYINEFPATKLTWNTHRNCVSASKMGGLRTKKYVLSNKRAFLETLVLKPKQKEVLRHENSIQPLMLQKPDAPKGNIPSVVSIFPSARCWYSHCIPSGTLRKHHRSIIPWHNWLGCLRANCTTIYG